MGPNEFSQNIDFILAEQYCKNGNFTEGLKRYEGILQYLEEIQLRQYILRRYQYGGELIEKQNYLLALEQYRKVLEIQGAPVSVYKNMGLCLYHLNEPTFALECLKQFDALSEDKDDAYILMGDVYFNKLKDNLKAIEYYEKAIELFPENFALFNMLGHLYSTVYRDEHQEEQIKYLTRAYELRPDERIVVKNLSYVLGKFGYIKEADEMYKKLLYMNPTHADLHSYGAYLVKLGRFYEGFRYLQHRYDKEDLPENAFPELYKNKEKQWFDGVDITGKDVVIHYEQGFGDTIMFSRFIPQIQERCNKVWIVVQNDLVDLMSDNFENVISVDKFNYYKLKYDLWIAMMDLPIVCNTTIETIPFSEGWLNVPQEDVDKFKKYIHENDKLKIGFAFEGTLSSKETVRDIPAKELQPILDLEGVQCYSFQYDDIYNQKKDIHGYIELKDTFHNWKDTACAMKNMDLIVTTDNGVMNLAGALGVKTFGIFNTISEWRWFKTEGKDIGWYKSIRPFKCPHNEDWKTPVKQIVKEIKKIQKRK